MLEPALCDLCGGSVFSALYPATIDPAADPADDFSTMRKHAGHCAIVRCRSCGLVLSHPRDDPQTLREVYARLADPSYDAEEPNRVWVARQRVLQIAQRFQPGRLLDIGCSTGIFAAEAARAGWQVSGVDPSEPSVARARLRAPQSDFTVGGVETAHFEPQVFDLITAWDVLEHVPSPTLALSRVRSWLKPGGWLVMNVPNADSWPARWMGRHWVLLLREHLWYFSPVTMGKLCEKTGLQVKFVQSNWVRFSLGGIAARLRQVSGPGRLVGSQLARLRGFASLAVQFPMGEMTVWAQRN